MKTVYTTQLHNGYAFALHDFTLLLYGAVKSRLFETESSRLSDAAYAHYTKENSRPSPFLGVNRCRFTLGVKPR